jgi:pyruvate dehydrogenase E1 component beta subunit
VVFFESELTYGKRGPVPEGEYLVPIGKADIKREGTDVTLVTWSKNLFLTLEVAEAMAQEGISCEVIDLLTLRPLDRETLLTSVAKTHRCVVIQEQHEVASYGAYLAHVINSAIFDELDAPVGVVSSLEAPMPYSKALEVVLLPSKERVMQAIRDVCA